MFFPSLYSGSHLREIRASLVNPDKATGNGGMGKHPLGYGDFDAHVLPAGSHGPAEVVENPIVEAKIAHKPSDNSSPGGEWYPGPTRKIEPVGAARLENASDQAAQRNGVLAGGFHKLRRPGYRSFVEVDIE